LFNEIKPMTLKK
jgi:hypothetical protein